MPTTMTFIKDDTNLPSLLIPCLSPVSDEPIQNSIDNDDTGKFQK